MKLAKMGNKMEMLEGDGETSEEEKEIINTIEKAKERGTWFKSRDDYK